MKALIVLSIAALSSLQPLVAHAQSETADVVVAERALVQALADIRADAVRSLHAPLQAQLAGRLAALEDAAAADVAVRRTEAPRPAL